MTAGEAKFIEWALLTLGAVLAFSGWRTIRKRRTLADGREYQGKAALRLGWLWIVPALAIVGLSGATGAGATTVAIVTGLLAYAALARLREFHRWMESVRRSCGEGIDGVRQMLRDIDYDDWLKQISSSDEVAARRQWDAAWVLDQLADAYEWDAQNRTDPSDQADAWLRLAALCEAPLEDVERAHILRILQQTGGVIQGPTGAAALLGLKPTTLESRIKKLGLTRPGTLALLPWLIGKETDRPEAVLRGAHPRDAEEPRDRRGQLPAVPRPRRPGDGDPRPRGVGGDLLHPVPRLGRTRGAVRDQRRGREVTRHD